MAYLLLSFAIVASVTGHLVQCGLHDYHCSFSTPCNAIVIIIVAVSILFLILLCKFLLLSCNLQREYPSIGALTCASLSSQNSTRHELISTSYSIVLPCHVALHNDFNNAAYARNNFCTSHYQLCSHSLQASCITNPIYGKENNP